MSRPSGGVRPASRPACCRRWPRSTGRFAAWRMARAGRAAGIPVVCIGNLTARRRRQDADRDRGGATAGRRRPAAVRAQPRLWRRAARTASGSIRRAIARARSATSRCCWRAWRRPSWRATASPAPHAARAAGADVDRDGRRLAESGADQGPCHRRWWTAAAASATARSFRRVRCGRRSTASSRRADAVLLIGSGAAGEAVAAAAQARGLPVFHGRLVPDPQALAALKGRPVLAFAGIGDPEKFFATLGEAGIDVRARLSFPDHHRYRAPRRST